MTVAAQAIGYVLEDEGGHVHDPNDPGGETKYGISQRAYPALDIAALTREDAINLYHRDYWLAAGCDRLPPPLGYCLLDAAVNMGVHTGVRHLQYALGVAQDGLIGPKTQEAAWQRDRYDVMEQMLGRRLQAYAAMEGFARYGTGWTRRTLRCYRRALLTHWEG